MEKYVPDFSGSLKKHMIRIPEVIHDASGIRIFGRLMRSIVFSTDVAIIRNINADAVIAVYPFTPQPVITAALMKAATQPVLCGVGGGITTGKRVANLAMQAEYLGAFGVVVNAPTPNSTIEFIYQKVDLPIIVTVVSENEDIEGRLRAGTSILNVSAAAKTPDVVASIRARYPKIAIIATGGPTDESISRTIEAGANAISWTPPTTGELFKEIMDNYREIFAGENPDDVTHND